MTEKDIKRKIIEIYMFMIKNGKKLRAYEVTELYRDYLKLYTMLSTNSPTFEGDLYNYNRTNCYCYALGIKFPWLFNKLYKEKTKTEFPHNVGFISGNEFNDNPQNILEYLFEDLEELKIKFYESKPNASIKHNGYKIALFISHDYEDFHFIRENTNGLWSEKAGYSDIIKIVEPPRNNQDNYELIKVLELVKPTLKK